MNIWGSSEMDQGVAESVQALNVKFSEHWNEMHENSAMLIFSEMITNFDTWRFP